MITPMFRALQQLDDPVFLGVMARSLAWSVLAFLGLSAASVWAVGYFLQQPGWLGWVAGIAGGLGAALLALWLFVPVALLIATLYIDRISDAVDRRFYPFLPPPNGAHVAIQTWDGVVLGAQVLGWQILGLFLAIILPGLGLILGWAITGWAIGRGLFVAVAMRRMSRADALTLYRRRRVSVLVQGGMLALAGTVPLLNLLIPVLGVAALTHILNWSSEPDVRSGLSLRNRP